MGRRRTAAVVCAAALAGLIAAGGAPLADPGGASRERREEALRLAFANAVRQNKMDLAGGEAFYLVLDPGAGRLQMLLKGAVLRDFPVLGMEVGYPRIAFLTRRPSREWQGQIFAEGELDPPRELDRLVIVAPPPSDEEREQPALPIPPTPEEKYPVPSRFHIRFEGGVSIEVRTNEAGPPRRLWVRAWHGLVHRVVDVWTAVTGRPRDTVRLRVLMAPDDARSLYRALPPATKLLVVPDERAGAAQRQAPSASSSST